MKLKIDTKEFEKLVRRAEEEMSGIARDAYLFFKQSTPYLKGNARRNTRLINGDTIVASYPYAERLDEGYSKKAPSGMTEPTEKYIEKTLVPTAIRRIDRG